MTDNTTDAADAEIERLRACRQRRFAVLADENPHRPDPALNCIIPGCEVNGPAPATCQIWGKRTMCYFHFAAYHAWSAEVCPFRAPTAGEWDAFVGTQQNARAA